MSRSAERIAETVLYEGYLLYPYRPSAVKNRQRFNFGVLIPAAAVLPGEAGSDRSYLQTECLVEGPISATLSVGVRFLHLVERVTLAPTESPWHEALERASTCDCSIADLLEQPRLVPFAYSAGTEYGTVGEGDAARAVVRRHRAVIGAVELSAEPCAERLVRIRVRVSNRSELPAGIVPRDELMLRSLVSAHAIIRVEGGELLSLTDPPMEAEAAAAACRNEGVWPVLVGEHGQRDAVLASPIILYDHPTIAPESSGDLFDATEIDEILSLRILTLTDDEKREVMNTDARARRLLERTEALDADGLMKLHGVMRHVGPVSPELA